MVNARQPRIPGVEWGDDPAEERTPEMAKPSSAGLGLRANRERVTAPDRGLDSETTPVTAYGVRHWPAGFNLSVLGPHGEDRAWREHGEQREVPTIGPDAPWAAQSHVSDERVASLAADPSKGSDPRFPWQELPHVEEIVRNQGDVRPTITQGTHRFAGAIARGQMFTPVDYMPAHRVHAAKQQTDASEEHYRGTRYQKLGVTSARVISQDPKEKRHLLNVHAEEVARWPRGRDWLESALDEMGEQYKVHR